jgi:hypothetical protein
MSFFFTIVKYNILELSECSGTTRPADRTMGGAASGWSRAARDVYEPCTGSCVAREGARRRSVGNFLASSPISLLRRANRCSAGLSFRQNRAARRPSWRPTARMRTLREERPCLRHSSARVDRSSGVNAFANPLRCLCHEGFGRDAGATVSNGLEPSAEPSSESSVQRTRAIPASNRRFAKANRIAGTQGRIGLNVPERHSPPAELSSRLDDGI